jgi:hypothetical protein
MMSASAIADLSRQAAVRAAAYELEPYVPADNIEPLNWVNVPIPNLGDYRPEGWCLVEHVLVDKSGFGVEWEPALTLRAFKAWASQKVDGCQNNGCQAGFGIIEEGQFQVVIGFFTDDPDLVGNCDDTREEYEIAWCDNCEEPYEKDEDDSACPWCGYDPDECPECGCNPCECPPFEEGDRVVVKDPEPGDPWYHSFEARVTYVDKTSETLTVVDQDDNYLDVDWDDVEPAYNPLDDPNQIQLPLGL